MTANAELIALRKLAEALRDAELLHPTFIAECGFKAAFHCNKVIELLDTIEAQSKQIEGLKSANIEDVATYKEIIDGLAKQITALQADAERLQNEAFRVQIIQNEAFRVRTIDAVIKQGGA
jgi:hypothetical protein